MSFSEIISWVGVGFFVVFFFGFCIFIHELGHFLAARWRGLHVIAFSIGFKKMWAKKYKGVEYRIGCLPFGGYVDLPQIDASGEPKDENDNPLPPAKPIDRIITAFAGPLFNILFGFALGVVIWIWGIPQDSPKMREITVASVKEESPEYKAGLRKGDKIVAIDGQSFYYTWMEVVRVILLDCGSEVKLGFLRNGEKREISYKPAVNKDFMPQEGLATPFFSPDIPLLVYPDKNGPAAKLGLLQGDEILNINGAEIKNRPQFARAILSADGAPMNIVVRREGREVEIKNIVPVDRSSDSFHSLGLNLKMALRLDKIFKGSPAANAGLKEGDIIETLNGAPAVSEEDPFSFSVLLKKGEGAPIRLGIIRDSKLEEVTLKPVRLKPDPEKYLLGISYSGVHAGKIGTIYKNSSAEKAGLKEGDIIQSLNGMPFNEDLFEKLEKEGKGAPIEICVRRGGEKITFKVAPHHYKSDFGFNLVFYNYPNPWEQFSLVVSMTYKSLRGVFSKDSSIKPRNFSGPLGIIKIMGTAAKGSFLQGLYIVVFITFSLGLLNLFPLPVLDGGHIVMSVVQMIIGRPIPAKIVQPVTITFVTLLIAFMLFVTYYDILRFLPAGWFRGSEPDFSQVVSEDAESKAAPVSDKAKTSEEKKDLGAAAPLTVAPATP